MPSEKKRKARADVIPLFEAESNPIEEFGQWLASTGYDEDPAPVVTILDSIFEILGQSNPDFQPTAWQPLDAHTLLALVDNMGNAPDQSASLVAMFHDYLEFLDETNRWTGNPDDLTHCGQNLARYLEGHVPPSLTPDDIELPSISPEEQLAGLSALLPVQQLRSLLAWLGEGKPATSTGVPRPALIAELAAAVGIELSEGHRTARSMHHIPRLIDLWNTATSTGLVKLTSTRASRGPLASEFEGAQTTSLPTVRAAVSHFVGLYFESDGFLDSFHAAKVVAAQIVLMSMTGTPPNELASEGISDTLNPYELESHSILLRMLLDFQQDGWLTLDGTYSVPEPIRPAVLDALTFSNLEDSTGAKNGISERLIVTVQLLHTDPLVWRKLELDASLTLDIVHEVLQHAFEWENSHLHQFVSGRSRHNQTIYAPAAWLDELGDSAQAEETVTIGSLLQRVGDVLTYEYDFGDGWEHSITLQSIAPPDSTLAGARCVDGANMTPYEDSGGPVGWNLQVAAASDPAHEDHVESRRWLGLRKNQTIDPTHFDLRAAKAAVDGLFDGS